MNFIFASAKGFQQYYATPGNRRYCHLKLNKNMIFQDSNLFASYIELRVRTVITSFYGNPFKTKTIPKFLNNEPIVFEFNHLQNCSY